MKYVSEGIFMNTRLMTDIMCVNKWQEKGLGIDICRTSIIFAWSNTKNLRKLC